MKAIAIFLIFIAGIFFGVLRLGYSSCEEPTNPGSETLETAGLRGNTCATVGGAFRVGVASLWNVTHDSHEEITAVGVVFITIFTIIIGIFMVDLASSANSATREIKNTSERQTRAYMGIRSGRVSLKQIGPQIFVEGHVFLKNFGKTPAYAHRTWVRIEVKDAARPPFDLPGNGFGGTIVCPDADANLQVQWPVSEPDIEAIRDDTKRIFVWGGADYVNAFGKAQFLKFYLWNAKEEPGIEGWSLIAADKADEAD